MAKQDLKSAVYACENGFGSEYGTRSQNPNALLATSGSLESSWSVSGAEGSKSIYRHKSK